MKKFKGTWCSEDEDGYPMLTIRRKKKIYIEDPVAVDWKEDPASTIKDLCEQCDDDEEVVEIDDNSDTVFYAIVKS